MSTESPFERTPDDILDNYVELCRESGKAARISEAGMLLRKTHGFGIGRGIRQIKAYAWENPGSFPDIRQQSPGSASTHLAIDVLLVAWCSHTLWTLWNEEGRVAWVSLVIGILSLLMARGQILYIALLAQRKRERLRRSVPSA